jgi:hypothetical protein
MNAVRSISIERSETCVVTKRRTKIKNKNNRFLTLNRLQIWTVKSRDWAPKEPIAAEFDSLPSDRFVNSGKGPLILSPYGALLY